MNGATTTIVFKEADGEGSLDAWCVICSECGDIGGFSLVGLTEDLAAEHLIYHAKRQHVGKIFTKEKEMTEKPKEMPKFMESILHTLKFGDDMPYNWDISDNGNFTINYTGEDDKKANEFYTSLLVACAMRNVDCEYTADVMTVFRPVRRSTSIWSA